MKSCLKIFWFFVLSFIIAVHSFGQNTRVIRVLDNKTHEPVRFAHVCFEPFDDNNKKVHYVTDMDGQVENGSKFRTILAVSYVGYETFYDTLQPNESKDVFLIPKMFNIDEVVVTAQFAPKRADKSIYKVDVINKMQLEGKGANNLNDALSTELNMRTSYSSATGSSLSLQGLSGENVKYLIDGVPVIGRVDGNIDMNQLNIYNADHIEIIEGPMSVIYGSNALAGVVNIITRENTFTKLQTFAEAYYESVGIYNLDAGVAYNKKNNSFFLAGGRSFFDGYAGEDTGRAVQWKPREQYNADAYYIYSKSDFKFKYTSQFFHEQLRDKGDLLAPLYEVAFDDYYHTSRLTNKIEISSKLKKNQYLSSSVSYSNYNRKRNKYYNDLTTLDKVLSAGDTTKINSFLARGSYSNNKNSTWLTYQTGFEITIDDGSSKRITGGKQDIGDYAAYISLETKPFKTFSFQPGVRFMYNTKYKAPIVYSFNVKYDLLKKIIFRASYSKGFRAPSFKELYLYFVDINHDVEGNENLKAEYSNSFNFSMNYNIEKERNNFGFEISLFYNDIKNKISLITEDDQVYTYINYDQYKTQGLRLKFKYNHYPRLSFRTGISETGRYNYVSEINDNAKKFSYSPDVSLSMTYKLLKTDIDISLYYKYNGKLPQIRGNEDYVYEAYIGDYHTLDISMMKYFLNNRLKVAIGGKNLFNNTSINNVDGVSGGSHGGSSGTSSSPVDWGRTFFAKVAFTFNKYN